jgi:hypothetical protein
MPLEVLEQHLRALVTETVHPRGVGVWLRDQGSD